MYMITCIIRRRELCDTFGMLLVDVHNVSSIEMERGVSKVQGNQMTMSRATNSDDDDDLVDIEFNEDGSLTLLELAMVPKELLRLLKHIPTCSASLKRGEQSSSRTRERHKTQKAMQDVSRGVIRRFLASRYHMDGWVERAKPKHGFGAMMIELRVGPIPIDREVDRECDGVGL